MRRATIFVVAVLLLLAPVTPVVASNFVSGNPELRYSVADNTFEPNQRAKLTVVAANDGDIDHGGPEKFEQQVQTARSVQMDILEDRIQAPIDVKTGTVTAGSIAPGGASPFTFSLELGDVKPGTYTIPVRVRYRHVRAVTFDSLEETEYVWLDEKETVNLKIHVESTSQFEVVSEGTNELFAGDTGTLAFTIQNTGTQTAQRASVDLQSKASGLFFGTLDNPQRSTSVYVQSLEPNETKRVSVQVGAAPELSTGEYPVDAVVSYKDDNGIPEQSDALTTGVMVRPERTFAMEDVSAPRLRVDESEAKVTGRIVNTGEGVARNVVVTLQPKGPVTPTNGETAVGDLDPGESAPVSFTVDVASDAEPGENSFSFDVTYENTEGDLRHASNALRKTVSIRPERDPFQVGGVSTTVTPGGKAKLTANVTYTGDDPVSAVNAKLFTSDPLSTSDDGAYLGSMDPGETKTATFRVSAGSESLVKEYAASVEVRYDEADGDTRFTDGMTVGIPVNEPSEGPPVPPVAVGAAVVVLLVAAGLWYRRR
ncbi:MAG: COG1361 S-layer family protein [Haloplanus sp.]